MGKSNAQKEAEKAAAAAKEAEEAEKAAAAAKEAEEAGDTDEPPGYVVAEGCAILCGRKIFAEGEPVKESNFANGKEGLADMVKAGKVVEG
jgi:hypothetical protein